jgi:transposase InsO family protein
VTCSIGTSPPKRRTGPGSWTSPTSAPGPGFVYVAFILDVFAQKITAWNVAPSKAVELVDVP